MLWWTHRYSHNIIVERRELEMLVLKIWKMKFRQKKKLVLMVKSFKCAALLLLNHSRDKSSLWNHKHFLNVCKNCWEQRFALLRAIQKHCIKCKDPTHTIHHNRSDLFTLLTELKYYSTYIIYSFFHHFSVF